MKRSPTCAETARLAGGTLGDPVALRNLVFIGRQAAHGEPSPAYHGLHQCGPFYVRETGRGAAFDKYGFKYKLKTMNNILFCLL